MELKLYGTESNYFISFSFSTSFFLTAALIAFSVAVGKALVKPKSMAVRVVLTFNASPRLLSSKSMEVRVV